MNLSRINWRNTPIITAVCCVICIILFIGINLEERPFTWEAYRRWGLPSTYELFHGDYWGFLSSNFLHTELWHIFFNLYWLYRFGKTIESNTTGVYYCLFLLSASLVCSVAQLAFSGGTGIGFSGVVYAQFGFLLAMKKNEAYLNSLDRKTIYLFLIWLVVCIILTKTRIWEVANAAHVEGLIWGVLLGYLYYFNGFVQLVVGTLSLAILTSSIFWSPFSVALLTSRAIEFHTNEKIDEAMETYRAILSRDADNQWAKDNLIQLDVYKLQKEAYHFHENKSYKRARELYVQILRLDSTNKWAQKNLKMLPDSVK